MQTWTYLARFTTRTYCTNEGCITRTFNHVQWPTLEFLGKLPGFPKCTRPFTAKPRSTYHSMSPKNTVRRQEDPTRVHFWHSTTVVIYKYSFWPRKIRDWNKLPPDVLNLDDNNTRFMSFQDFAGLICRCSPCRPFCWCLLRAAELKYIEISH